MFNPNADGEVGALARTGFNTLNVAGQFTRIGGQERFRIAALAQSGEDRFLFIRPYEALARILWERVDEGVIDDSLDRLARILGRTGEGLGSWTTGRVSVYLLSLAAGLALIIGYLAWTVL